MTAFLLIWSPKKWPWPELPDIAKRVAAGEAVADVWGCGFARGILPGDRVFLHRVARQPKGIFGSGYVTRAPYEVPDASTKRGYRLCIDFVYDWLVDAHQAPVITREQLRIHPFSVQTWDAQSSGTIIKPIAEGALEKRWGELTGKRKPPKFDAPAGPTRSTKVTAHTAAAQKTASLATAKPATPSEQPATKRRNRHGQITRDLGQQAHDDEFGRTDRERADGARPAIRQASADSAPADTAAAASGRTSTRRQLENPPQRKRRSR